jgi:hypothetical protein
MTDLGRKPPQCYAGKNVRFDISIAQSRRSGVGQPKSRLLGAHAGRPRSLLIFPKADIPSFGSAER